MAKRVQKSSNLEAARAWLARGIRVIPIKRGTKKPIGDGWQNVRLKKDELAGAFSRGEGVGGLWGKPSSWVVDVDLDCDEAVAAAKVLLPKTYVYGRGERPQSHYLYTCEGSKTTKFLDPETREMIVELRSTGAQSLLPPTKHPDGDRFEVNREGDFAKVSFNKLVRILGELASVSLAAKYYPEKGGRHDFIHAFTGSILHSGGNAERAERLSLALLAAVGGKETDREQRERTVKNTIEHHSDSRTAGWKTLGEFIPAKALAKIRAWLKAKGEESGESSTVDGLPTIVKNGGDQYEPLPKDLYDVDGVLAQIMRWSAQCSHVKQPLFDLATAFFCTALSSQNKYVVGAWNTPLQPYFMLLAPTSGGKDSALNSVYEYARGRGLEERVVSGLQSWYALVDKLSQPPHVVAWTWDEAARKLQSAGRSASPEHSVITWMLQAYGKANKSTPAIPGRNVNIPAIEHPFLITMAAAQPKALVQAASSSDLTTGTLNRFILFDAGGGGSLNHQRDFSLRSVGKAWMQQIREAGEDFYRIDMGTNTYKSMVAFADECHREATSEKNDYTSMWGRAHQNALILAGLLAISRDPQRPKITSADADWAVRFVRWSVGRWLALLGGNVSQDHMDAKFLRVERHIRNVRQLVHRARTERERKFAEAGFMHHSFLVRLCRLDQRTFEAAIQMLTDGGVIGEGEKDDQRVYWAK